MNKEFIKYVFKNIKGVPNNKDFLNTIKLTILFMIGPCLFIFGAAIDNFIIFIFGMCWFIIGIILTLMWFEYIPENKK